MKVEAIKGPDDQKMSTCLFHAIADALRALDILNIEAAREGLIRARQQAEDAPLD